MSEFVSSALCRHSQGSYVPRSDALQSCVNMISAACLLTIAEATFSGPFYAAEVPMGRPDRRATASLAHGASGAKSVLVLEPLRRPRAPTGGGAVEDTVDESVLLSGALFLLRE